MLQVCHCRVLSGEAAPQMPSVGASYNAMLRDFMKPRPIVRDPNWWEALEFPFARTVTVEAGPFSEQTLPEVVKGDPIESTGDCNMLKS